MADLVQIVHTAITDTADIPAEIEWAETYRDLVPASNRRRILDREHAKGRTPQADGWLHMPHACSSDTWRHQRIRWEDPRLLEATNTTPCADRSGRPRHREATR